MQNKDVQLIMFSAPWCSWCKALKKSLDKEDVPYIEINVDEEGNEGFVSFYNVRSLPTTIGLKGEEIILSVVGVGAIKEIMELLN